MKALRFGGNEVPNDGNKKHQQTVSSKDANHAIKIREGGGTYFDIFGHLFCSLERSQSSESLPQMTITFGMKLFSMQLPKIF